MTKLIPLNRGLFTLVDDADFERVRDFRWFTDGEYAYRTIRVNGKNKNIKLHRELLSAPDGTPVDHINHDTLDNRGENIRLVTTAQNNQNYKGPRRDCLAGVRGVETDVRRRKRYRACVWISGKRIVLGTFEAISEAEAAAKHGRSRLMTHAPESRQGVGR